MKVKWIPEANTSNLAIELGATQATSESIYSSWWFLFQRVCQAVLLSIFLRSRMWDRNWDTSDLWWQSFQKEEHKGRRKGEELSMGGLSSADWSQFDSIGPLIQEILTQNRASFKARSLPYVPPFLEKSVIDFSRRVHSVLNKEAPILPRAIFSRRWQLWVISDQPRVGRWVLESSKWHLDGTPRLSTTIFKWNCWFLLKVTEYFTQTFPSCIEEIQYNE